MGVECREVNLRKGKCVLDGCELGIGVRICRCLVCISRIIAGDGCGNRIGYGGDYRE